MKRHASSKTTLAKENNQTLSNKNKWVHRRTTGKAEEFKERGEELSAGGPREAEQKQRHAKREEGRDHAKREEGKEYRKSKRPHLLLEELEQLVENQEIRVACLRLGDARQVVEKRKRARPVFRREQTRERRRILRHAPRRHGARVRRDRRREPPGGRRLRARFHHGARRPAPPGRVARRHHRRDPRQGALCRAGKVS